MSGVYKITELVGTSPVSYAEATKAAVAEAAKTVRHMDWLEVLGQSARIKDGKIEEFQVKVKIGFKIERYMPTCPLLERAEGRLTIKFNGPFKITLSRE